MLITAARELLQQALADPTADFRDGQWEAIELLVERRERLLVVQRTGWGKSIVYFLATRIMRGRGAGLTLLISPLLALMRNQVAAAQRMGLRAMAFNSDTHAARDEIRLALSEDRVDVLLIAPERLTDASFREFILAEARIGMLVVDEAHCISDWGMDFRPDYLRIGRIVAALAPGVPVLATTATANDRVVADLEKQFGPHLHVQRGPLLRASLQLQNIIMPDQAARLAWLAEHVPRLPGSGVIYTLTTSDARTLADWLKSQGIAADAYWGDLPTAKRMALEERLLNNDLKALVATVALGLGFDKPDLGFVIHCGRPASPLTYYQQVGRAGRSLDVAYGILLSCADDVKIHDSFRNGMILSDQKVSRVLRALRLAEDGLTEEDLERQINMDSGDIDAVLKVLTTLAPSPVLRRKHRWYATPVPYVERTAQAERITRLLLDEDQRMQEYVRSGTCLMQFLARELSDPHTPPCGKCAVCLDRPLLPDYVSYPLTRTAGNHLRNNPQKINPPHGIPGDALAAHGWHDRIPPYLQVADGYALSRWGDHGWSDLVRVGKQETKHFDDRLVVAATQLIVAQWQPPLAWVTCVPSLNHPPLVPDFARRLAQRLGLPFHPVVECTATARQPQKKMENSYQQARNLAGAFAIVRGEMRPGAVLLVDDMFDSGWTFSVIGALLRAAGSGPVYPFALTVTSGGVAND